MKNKKNGFSLIEIILGLAVISLTVSAIYMSFNSKRMAATVDRQVILLQDITDRATSAFLTAQEPQVAATTSNFINMQSIPKDLVDTVNNKINNLFGGTIEISGTNPLNDPLITAPTSEADAGAINILVNGIPDFACTRLATSSYADNTYLLKVNGIAVKAPGEIPQTQHIVNITNSCVSGNNNNIEYTYSLFRPDLIPHIVGNGSNRNKELPQNIADIGPALIAAQMCSGGSSWNADSASCICSATSFWNGASCVTYRSNIGNCEPGTGWNGAGCVPHSKVGQVSNKVLIKTNDFSLPVGSTVTNPGETLVNGRKIPQVGYPSEIITNWQYNSVAPSSIFKKEVCLSVLDFPGIKQGIDTGYHCSVCTGGSIWDNLLKRCVTN